MSNVEQQEVRLARKFLLLRYIELDLRNFIAKTYSPSFNTSLDFIPDIALREAAFHRFQKTYPDAKVDEDDIATKILEFLYPMDLISIIRANPTFARPEENKHIKKYHEHFENFIGKGRNEFFHHRETDEDIDEFIKFCSEFSQESEIWVKLKDYKNILLLSHEDLKENKEGLFDKKSHIKFFNELLFNNLPAEDYLDWGFTGRRAITDTVQRELFSNNRNAIMLFGSGGIGKTSIARYICEKQLTRKNVNFIWWHTSKTRTYSKNRIEAHAKNIINLKEVENLILETTGFTFHDLKEEEDYKPMFVLDNMENQKEDEVTRLVNKLSSVGKVIVTGRNALPNIEAFPLQIGSLTEKESDQFLKRVAKFYGQREILNADVKTSAAWMKKLGNSPLFIRSFVEAVRAGKSSKEYFDKFDDYDELIDFVFYNVTDNFSEDAKSLISTLEVDQTSLSSALIGEATGWDSNRVLNAVSIIRNSPLIETDNKSNLDHYKLTTLGKRYVKKHMSFSQAKKDLEKDKILHSLKLRDEFKLREIVSRISDTSYFVTYDEQEHLAGYQLNETLLESDTDMRIEKLEALGNKWLDFTPIQLHLGLLYNEKNYFSLANEKFQLAIQYSNEKLNTEKSYFQFINFLISQKDYRQAKDLFQEIEKEGSLEVKILGLKLSLDTAKPESFDHIYNLYEITRLPSDKAYLTSEVLKIVTEQSEILASNNNFTDAKMYMDDFLINLEGKFIQQYFDDNTVNFFIKSFLLIYFKVYSILIDSSSASLKELTAFVATRDFYFSAEHYETIESIIENHSKSITDGFIDSLSLEQEYELFLAQRIFTRNIEREKRGTVVSKKISNNIGNGRIENDLGENLIFYEGNLEGLEFDELAVGDKVIWKELIKHNKDGYLNEAKFIKKLETS